MRFLLDRATGVPELVYFPLVADEATCASDPVAVEGEACPRCAASATSGLA